MRGGTWIKPTFGVALGATVIDDAEGSVSRGATRLYRILMVEATHPMWELRCQRCIARGDDCAEKWRTANEIRNNWLELINQRLTLNRLTADRRKYGTKAMKRKMVLLTWKGTLKDEKSVPDEWIDQYGVLMGIEPTRGSGRHRVPH
ncbi:uncharacterized protein BT62DRAFT_708241 [Guyanagaster necrorhizus]|uniref:Uncharacterized protein n=1 Tax=Guyanagaster necrorhizus TaxID=856835 RepID=A0A9P8AUQ2_9AGAR|nr:uncharacterized protein BT62DRAFT_708241 [Guyanagaster necrorhizus MCA 3950]KAG7448475.1 hypothetical protein BT62DRAFT_708241 [Guyanagaster necrorhizus MCA 3950]